MSFLCSGVAASECLQAYTQLTLCVLRCSPNVTPVRCLCTACRPCMQCFAPLGSHSILCSSTTLYLTQAQPSSTPCCMLLRLCLLPPYSQSLSAQARLPAVSKCPCPAAISCKCDFSNCRLRSKLTSGHHSCPCMPATPIYKLRTSWLQASLNAASINPTQSS